ncbi:MAG: mannose-1-phosphate guanylyltransferase/mannose-6-phosphate isomerase [Gammaproteobacteria bacterium]|nr:mannose-1-phosphate guanylyltransferase/mannose-6-phosphate isomerase [Gammaproteobacteria bacterium]
MQLLPVILSGGSGSRLWPLSREHYPKQLLPLIDDATLLQQTVARPDGVAALFPEIELVAPVIVCNVEHRFLIAEQLRQVGKRHSAIVLEPTGRNTAPALTLAALAAVSHHDDPVLLVMAADHVIQKLDVFHRAAAAGAKLAQQGYLVTFGIVPSQAETGYGYIRRGSAMKDTSACAIQAFVEKPDKTTAESYLASGEYFWNSGMFMMRASVWLAAIQQFQPKIYASCEQAYRQGRADMDFYRLDEAAFALCPSDSIDYAVMEKLTANRLPSPKIAGTAVIPLDAGWSDIGAWSSLWEVKTRDPQGNVVSGDVFVQECAGSYLASHSRLLACVGIDNLIVVETSDAVLVANKDKAQDVKKIVEWLKKQGRPESQTHQRVYRPWGSYESVVDGARFQVKRIVVNPEAALSLQMHHHRAEHWIVVTGTARVTRGDEVFLLSENQSTYIPLGTTHRLENPGKVPLEMIEVQSGSYLGEDDIVRFSDQYGRSPA